MVIEYIVKNPSFFIRYFESIASLNDEGRIQFGKRIRFVGLDSSRIAVFELVIGEDNLEIIKEDEDLEIAIKFEDLEKILKRTKTPDELRLKTDNDNSLLVIAKKENKTKTFRLNQIDLTEELQKDPMKNLSKLNLKTVFKIKASDLLEAIEDCLIYSEACSLDINNDTLLLKANSPNGECDIQLKLDNETFTKESVGYGTEWLQRILKPMSSSDIIVMTEKDKPICLYDKLSEKSWMKYYLAPRVEDQNAD